MTAIALPQFCTASSGGTSQTARFIAKETQEGCKQLQESYILGQQGKGSFNELYQVFEGCRHPNWDGYGAAPVSVHTFRSTYEFLEALPLGTPAPSVGAEPDGQHTLEWYRSPRQILSVSVSPEGELHYAALIGDSKHYGTEPFYGEAPKAIVDLIHRVLAV